MNIGILIIATNKYITFVKPLVDSINKYFLPSHNKKIFCFTDKIKERLQDNVIKIKQKHLQWPLATLKRYEIFYENKKYYEDMEVLYYLDADMLIVDMVGDEFLPDKKDLVCVIHPGYTYTRKKMQTFERRTQSTAFVDDKHYVYHCGGVQGGKTKAYLDVCGILSNNINTDLMHNIIAVWHDESHWNKYLIAYPDSYKQLNSSYCYPEFGNMDLPKKIIALNKNHNEMRNGTYNWVNSFCKRLKFTD